MSMEFFAWPWADGFFGADARKFRYSHLAGALTFIPYGTMVDHFQHIVYEHPELKFEDAFRHFQLPPTAGKAVIAAVPTTSGTGSETTCCAVLTNERTHQKELILGFEIVPEWRWQQEVTLQEANPDRQAMTKPQVQRFVQFFERTSRQAMASLSGLAERTITLDKQRNVKM